jgi:DNA-binding transcriptional MocR family regulator
LLSLERKKEIYALCERYDVLIIEDEPYWYLQYTSTPTHPHTSSERYPFLSSLTPSFVTIDTSGRVLRLDTFSKSIAPGCRLGWITAQQPFIDRLSRIAETTTQAPSGFSQALVVQLLQNIWGMDGWVNWLQGLRCAYEARMRAMCRVLHAHTHTTVSRDLGDATTIIDKLEMYSFQVPAAGMFVWVHVHITAHPSYTAYLARGHSKREMVARLWAYTAKKHSCLSCPGWIFAADDDIREDGAAERMRLCFAAIEDGLLVDATLRFCTGMAVFWEFSAEEIETCCKPLDEFCDASGGGGGGGGGTQFC